jgi:hypothetical protein
MRKVLLDPGTLASDAADEWQQLLERADAARVATIAAALLGKATFDTNVWRDIKWWLWSHAFGKRCAYCEGSQAREDFPPHAEHYRPKGTVTTRVTGVGAPVRVTTPEGECDHAGYFWLAYDWRNLVPACQRCNSGAKGTQFPVRARHVYKLSRADAVTRFGEAAVAAGTVYVDPAGAWILPSSALLDELEDPLLLHPCNPKHDPQEHLRFDAQGGVVAVTEQGRETIAAFKLNHPALTAARRKEQRERWRSFVLAYSTQMETGVADAQAWDLSYARLERLVDSYSAAVFEYTRARTPRPADP